MAKNSGLGTASMELLRPTTPQPRPEPIDDVAPVEDTDESRGDTSDSNASPKRTRRTKASASSGKTRARNLRLNDDVHDRLWLLARQRRQTVSAVANDLLDKALPRWELKRQG